MKMKLSEIITINNALKTIIDDDNMKIDALLKFRFLGIMSSVETYIENFNVIRRDKICEYGENDENGNFFISQKNETAIKKYTNDINEIIASEVEVKIEKIKANDLFNIGIPAEILVKLYGIMEE